MSRATKQLALVIGAHGGIGRAVADRLSNSEIDCDVIGFSRESTPPIDLNSETSIESAARFVSAQAAEIRLVLVATGFLHDDAFVPERGLRHLNREHMLKSFEINAVGPALVMKHFLPLLPRAGRSVFAVLSAKVGSIGDNILGGWHSYRASKAALNQLVRTAAIELKRRSPRPFVWRCIPVRRIPDFRRLSQKQGSTLSRRPWLPSDWLRCCAHCRRRIADHSSITAARQFLGDVIRPAPVLRINSISPLAQHRAPHECHNACP